MKFHLNFLVVTAIAPALAGVIQPARDSAKVSGVCELTTRAEVIAAAGAPVPAGAESPVDVLLGNGVIQMQVCFYGSDVLVARYDFGTRSVARFNQYRQSLATSEGFENVNGVGDEAFAAQGQLHVRKGRFGLNVDVGKARGVGAKKLQHEIGLAKLAVSRL